MQPKISIVVAMSENNVIGHTGKIPWHLAADMKHFKSITRDRSVIMGRKTFESIVEKLGHALPLRKNIIISRQKDFKAEGCFVVHSWEDALKAAKDDGDEIFVIGGAEIYKLALPQTDRIYLTKVHVACHGDAFFPQLKEIDWEISKSEDHPEDAKNEFPYTFQIYERKK